MANLTITIPDNILARVGSAFVNYYSKEYAQAQIANPSITANQFAKRKVIEYMKKVVTSWEEKDAADTAGRAALQTAVNEITLT